VPSRDRTILPGHPISLKKRAFYLSFSLLKGDEIVTVEVSDEAFYCALARFAARIHKAP